VIEQLPRVLLAGIGRGPFEAIAPVLDRQRLQIERVDTPEDALKRAHLASYHLVIFDAEPREMSLEEMVQSLRAEYSASSKCSLLVIAEPGKAQAAHDLIDNGVNRVMYLDDPEELIEKQVADLLHIAPRAAVRFAARLYTSLDDGVEEVFGQTSNVSVTGMLVQTPTMLEPGQRVAFEILLDGSTERVSGEAEVIRRAVPDRGGVSGIGVHFLTFESHGRDALDNVLEDALAEPLDANFDA
jgi:DNA-binding NarL/FixJ family response regulator